MENEDLGAFGEVRAMDRKALFNMALSLGDLPVPGHNRACRICECGRLVVQHRKRSAGKGGKARGDLLEAGFPPGGETMAKEVMHTYLFS